GPAAVPGLIEFLKEQRPNADNKDPLKRNPTIWAAGTLGKIGPRAKDAVPELFATLNSTNASEIHYPVEEALKKIGPGAVPALGAALKDEKFRGRAAAVRALVHIGPKAKQAVPALAAALQDKESLVRYHAAEALGNIGAAAREAVPPLGRALEKE